MQMHQGNITASRGIGREVEITDLVNVFGNVRAVDGVSMQIAAGEFVSMLGPSGSGKTTTMMSIAGFVNDYSGSISIGGTEIDHLPPHRRDIGVVFQDLALFPHMTVEDNIAFPLRMRGWSSSDVRQAVGGALDMVRLKGMGERLPAQLSGGQRQRVAVARSLVFKPPVLLLDEPFGALDKKLREDLHVEIKTLHRQLGITIVLVTHDQSEAMAMSDRVAVMNNGRIEQFATPVELYTTPANRFVAQFVGESSMLSGELREHAGGDRWTVITEKGLRLPGTLRTADTASLGSPAHVMIRPEYFSISSFAQSGANTLPGTITDIVYLGDRIRYDVRLSETDSLLVMTPAKELVENLKCGQEVSVSWPDGRAEIFLK